jgi:L-lactate dehydrogenase
MPKVSIIGAGDVGATLAYAVQLSGLATEVVLVDTDAARAEGQALDMSHGLPFVAPVLVRAGTAADCADSKVMVLTAGARQRPGETRLALMQRNVAITTAIVSDIGPHLGEACLLVVANPVDVLTRVAAETLGLRRGQIFGSGTVLDSARFRYELSLRCRVDARNVHAYVVGEHGDSEVFLWSSASIGAVPLDSFCHSCRQPCAKEQRSEVEGSVRGSAQRLIDTKGYTNYGVSLAVRRILEAVLRDERSVLTVSAPLAGEYGLAESCLSVPRVVGAHGVEQVVEVDLAPEERDGLARSAGVLAEAWAALRPPV